MSVVSNHGFVCVGLAGPLELFGARPHAASIQLQLVLQKAGLAVSMASRDIRACSR